MPRELDDRQDRLFGRGAELRTLSERVEYKGLTAVVARPMMGKSWLLTELARRLETDKESPRLIGFAESSGETPDLLLRSVVDLYACWLSDSDYWAQAKMVWDQQKTNLLPGVAKTITKIFKEIVGGAAKPAAIIVEDAINGLVSANQTLTSGGVTIPALQYEQARDLVKTVHQIAGRPVVLFLDAWDMSPDPEFESKTLNAFLRRLDDWPPCHVFLALRPEGEARQAAKQLEDTLPGPAKVHALEPMKLEDAKERRRLLGYVRAHVPAAAAAEEQDLLELIDGYPGVIYQWSSDYQRDHMKTLEDLRRIAENAQGQRFSELEALLPELDGVQRRLALRLALLPSDAAEIWPRIREQALHGLEEALIDDLVVGRVLEAREPPSFGHATRWEVARAWLLEHRLIEARTEGSLLIVGMASRLRGLDPETAAIAAALWSLLPVALENKLGDLPVALCQAAATLFGQQSGGKSRLEAGAKQAESAELSDLAPLLALGLFNERNAAKEEGNLKRRDAQLAGLRALAEAHPQDNTAREHLAKGLVNTLVDAKAEQDLQRRDTLLADLRGMAEAMPVDGAVRKQLAMGLFNTLNNAKEERDLQRRDALLMEQRALAEAHPEDGAVRGCLAKSLFNTLIDVRAEGDLQRRDALLLELRAMAEAHLEDGAVRDCLARGLLNTLNDSKNEEDLQRRDTLLSDLRVLAAAKPEDGAVRKQLAMGLFNMLNDANKERDQKKHNALLADLRGLAEAYPEDAVVRGNLAMGLFNSLNVVKEEGDLQRRDALLAELRTLAETQPEDDSVRKQLAMGLFNTLIDAHEERDLQRRDALLVELRALAEAKPEDGSVREHLAMGLVNTLYAVQAEGDLQRRDALLIELRILAKAHPKDGAIRDALAKAKSISRPSQ